MVASLLKVISSGIQDERLDFRPTVYPFLKEWVRAGRFTTRWERLEFENQPALGSTSFFRLLRKGHLITRLVLVATLPDLYQVQKRAAVANGGAVAFPSFGWTNSIGHAMIQEATLRIGGSRVETLDGRLMEVLDEFYTPLEKVPAVNQLIGRTDHGFTEFSFGWPPAQLVSTLPYPQVVHVPLPFWFCRGDPGCAFPIDAISVDEVRVGITFRGINGLYSTSVHVPNTDSSVEGASLWPLLGSSFYAQDPSVVSGQTPLSDANGVIQMPLTMPMGECYVMAEYVYLDQVEANRFRIADLQVPVVQHYRMEPYDSRGLLNARIPLDIPNPTRDLFFYCQPYLAPSYNAHFLATRDLTGTVNTLPNGQQTPWWPDAVGLSATKPSLFLRPGFALSDSEPLSGYALEYSDVRFRTEGGALFRSVVPSYEMCKSPWFHRYYYHFPLGVQNGTTPLSQPFGEANLDKIPHRDLVLRFRPPYGALTSLDVGRFMVYVYAETYNILRVYGGRAGLLFAY